MSTDSTHPGGGFNPPEPTTRGGPDYGRFVEAVRTLQDHARAADAPDAVISEAADLIDKVSDINYRKIAPIEKELRVDAGIERIEGRKIFVVGRLCDGDDVLTDAEALFVRLKPGQP